MKTKLFLITIFLSALTLQAANVKFYDINSIHGINIRKVASICKDDNGFIWASSNTGIMKISEDNYQIYQLPYATADVINVKLAYDNKTLLAYTNNGQLFSYNTLLDKFDLVADIRGMLNNNHLVVKDILIDPTGSFLIASSIGLFKYSTGNMLSQLAGDSFTDTYNILWQNEDHIFVVDERGFFSLNIKTLNRKNILGSTLQGLLESTSLFFDNKTDRLWIGTTSNGLLCLDLGNGILSEVSIKSFPKQPIQSITANSDSTLLVGIDGQGIWEIDKVKEKVLNIYKEDVDNLFSLKGDGVYDIFYDELNKRVWVCTYSGGLSYYDEESSDIIHITHLTNNQNSLNNNNVNKIIEDKKGNLWFATDNGVSCLNATTNEWTTYFANKHEQAQVFLSISEDSKGNIWAGTYSSGVYVIDGKSGKEIAHYSKDSGSELTNNYIFDIFKDSEGDLWLGGARGETYCFIEKENKFKPFSYFPVYTFAELKPGYIILACTNGLYLLNKQSTESELLLDGLLVQDALVINDNIWLVTSGNGLVRYNLSNDSVESFTTEAGLPSNYINSILCDGEYLWLGTENGLCRFDPENHSVFILSSVSKVFNASFNHGSSFRLNNGDLILGTNKGAIRLNPKAVNPSKSDGRIFLQDFFVSGRSIRETPSLKLDTPLDSLHNISLGYDQNTLTLQFLAIGPVTANSKFSWKMEGIDDNWSQPTNSRVLTYASMPSGTFKLKIRMLDNSFTQLLDERTIDIHIAPPFWATWRFRLINFALVIAILYLVFRFYINRLKQQHTEDKIRFFTNTAHDIRTSLTLIGAPIEELNKEKHLSDEGRYYLNLATEQTGRLSFVATQLLDFQKVDIGKGQLFPAMGDIVSLVFNRRSMFSAAAKKQGITLNFHTNQQSFITAFDKLKIEKVVDNLISNAIKYSHPNGTVDIYLHCDKDKWTLKVTDYGLGISEKAQSKLFREFYRAENVINSKIVGSGIGLLLVKSYVSLHEGTISIQSKENEGSTFQIVIPYKEVSDIHQVVTSPISAPEPALAPAPEVIEAFCKDKADSEDATDNSDNKKENVLVVEDNNDLQNFLRSALQSHFNVSVADDGADAWEQIQKQLPELIISDIMMPNMDGFELCHKIKTTYETSHIPVVLLTALTEKEQQLQGLGIGADDYITKPFDMSILIQRTKSIIQNRKVIRDKALKLIQKTDDTPIMSNQLNDKFVKDAIEVVRKNISNPEFDREAFASEMNVSSSLLYKKLKSLTDQSPIDFIRGIRLNHAVRLLQSGNHTVTEVSELCGFSSVKYFSLSFKNYFGEPPSRI